jgi:hypothetical protein
VAPSLFSAQGLIEAYLRIISPSLGRGRSTARDLGQALQESREAMATQLLPLRLFLI